ADHRLRASSAHTRSISGSGLSRSERIVSTRRNFSTSGSLRISSVISSTYFAIADFSSAFITVIKQRKQFLDRFVARPLAPHLLQPARIHRNHTGLKNLQEKFPLSQAALIFHPSPCITSRQRLFCSLPVVFPS